MNLPIYHIFIIGKTLILEAAAKTLSDKEDTEVVFIMALGETQSLEQQTRIQIFI